MDIISIDSGGHNVVSRAGAGPQWYPAEAAPAAVVDVWRKSFEQPYEEATFVGSFPPGASFEFDFNPVTDRNLQLAAISRSAHGTPSVSRLRDAVWATLLLDRGDTAIRPPTPLTVAADTLLDGTHSVVFVDTSTGPKAVTLPSAAQPARITVKNVGAGKNRATVDTTGAETINGRASIELADGGSVTLVADTEQENWQTVL